MSEPHDETSETVIRDKRRIDPETGELRTPVYDEASAAAPHVPVTPGGAPDDAQTTDRVAAELEAQLAERTSDLQRLKAEFDNYRRRVERDRQAVADIALANVLANLLPVLDDIGRAREHGELEGGFKSVAEALEATTVKLGLTPFGEPGDAFDPQIHEALTHAYGENVTEPTCAQVYQPGYKLGDRILRAARVAVVEPDSLLSPSDVAAASQTDEGTGQD